MRTLKIVNGDGSGFGTRVIDVVTGEMVDGVKSVRFEHHAGGIPVVTLELNCPVVDFVAKEGLATGQAKMEVTDTVEVLCDCATGHCGWKHFQYRARPAGDE